MATNATNAIKLQQYFANMDREEEEGAKLAGVTPDEYREAALPSTGPLAALDRAANLARIASIGPQMGESLTPPSMMRPKTLASAVVRGEPGLSRVGRVLREPVDMPETVPSLSMPSGVPAKTTDFASLQKLMSPGALKAPEAQPIPVANAPSGSDAAAPVTSALPATTETQPAGKPNSAGMPGLPAPSSEGAGGDAALGRLSIGQALTRALEGSGSVISGQNLRSGAADTLGDRMKQIEALRAKKEERFADVAQEQAQYEGANLATLTTQLAAFKDRPDIVAALLNLKPGAKYAKPNDFIKSMYQAVTNPPTVAAKEAATGKTLVQIPDIQAGTAGKVAKNAEIGPEGESKRELRAAQVAKIYKDMEITGAKLALDERKTIEQAKQTQDSFKKLESLNTIADKKEFGGFTTLAGDLSTLERIAPGFVTKGEVPVWLTLEQQFLGQKWPTSTNPQVVEFLAAYGKVANEERHRQYGSAQTDGELRSFMAQLNANPLSAGPKVLARQVKLFANAAGRVAKGRLTRYNNVFGAENVNTVFSPEWKPLFDTGGVFAAQGSPFVATPAPAATSGAPEAATVTIKRKADGKIKTVPAADRAKWLTDPEFEEVK